MQKIGFGSIEDLIVVDGEPLLDPRPRIIRVIKLREFASAEPRNIPADYILKVQTVQLLACIGEIGNGTIRRIEVQGGLPFKIEVEGIQAVSDPAWEERT